MTLLRVSEAVEQRQSTRAFLDRPVELEQVRDLVRRAGQAPSGGNIQPWKVYVVSGQPKAKLTAKVLERAARNDRETSVYPIYPSGLWDPLDRRRREAGEVRFKSRGQTRETSDVAEMERDNYRFFGAPVGLFLTLDHRCGPPQWADAGIFLQTFMLLAEGAGLSTCPQEVWALWPRTVGEAVGFDETEVLYTGLSLGYGDKASPLNAYRTSRAPLEEFAVFSGF